MSAAVAHRTIEEGDTIRLHLNGEVHDVTVGKVEPAGGGGFIVTPKAHPCHCIVRDNRWRRQAETCPQHRDGQPWEDE